MNPKEIVESGYNKIYKTYHGQRRIWDNKKILNDLVKCLPKNSKILDVVVVFQLPKFLLTKVLML